MKEQDQPLQAGFQIKFANLRKPVNILVWCKQEYAITTMDNQSVLKRLVEVESAKGTKIQLLQNNGKNVAVQKYPGKTKEEIFKIIKQEIKKGSGKELDRK